MHTFRHTISAHLGSAFFCLAILLLLSAPPLPAQSPGDLDLSFETGSTVNSTVWTVAPAGDGKVYIGGNFSSVRDAPRNRIARLNTDGSADLSFDPESGPNSSVSSVVVQEDGKVIIGGSFTSYNGTPRNRIARLNADGSLDIGFDPGTGANNNVESVALQADGKVIIGVRFNNYDGTGRGRIARLNPSGSLDTSFDPGTGANNSVLAVALRGDGKVLISGEFNGLPSSARAPTLNGRRGALSSPTFLRPISSGSIH